MATEYIKSPYREVGLNLKARNLEGKEKRVFPPRLFSVSHKLRRGALKMGHKFQLTANRDMEQCSLCRSPRFAVEDQKCKGARK
jgi:hypothetical protein